MTPWRFPMAARYRGAALALLAAVLAIIGIVAVHHMLAAVHGAEIRSAFAALRPAQILAAMACTAASYFVLTGYDVLALRLIGRPLPWRTAAFASFVSYSIANNFGLALLTGSSARYRIYSAAGLSAGDIGRVVATTAMTFWAGFIVMAGAALVLHHGDLAVSGLAFSAVAQRLTGVSILAVAAVLVVASGRRGRTLRLGRWHLPLPNARQAVALIAVAAIDLVAASAALWVLLPNPQALPFPALFLGYVLAIVVALVSHVPGGIGVFEAVMLVAVPDVARPGLVAALIAYRAIYYLLPLLVAAMLVAVREGLRWRQPVGRAFDVAQSVAGGVAPLVLSALTFAGGLVLLVSGALPGDADRLRLLRHFVPLPFVEATHIAASLAGTVLLLLAPALFKRLDGAFVLTRALLVAGALFSLAKGVDYEEALLLLTIAALLQWTRRAFYRHTALTMTVFSPAWAAAVALAAGLAMAIGLFAYKQIAYDEELWWQFAWHGDASRFLRASFAVAILLFAITVSRLFRPAIKAEPNEDGVAPSDAALAGAESTDANLALTGDKRFLFSPAGDAFVMYQIQGHSWIVMGDPVGAEAQWPDLLWQLRDRADAAQGRLLLYQISAASLPIAIDLGLQLVKYGEEARIDLGSFSLEGPAARDLRYVERRAAREGAEFAVIDAAAVPALIPELRKISDQWLATKGHSEKMFSVGRFDAAYLARFDCAVVRHAGQIVAFANIWKTADRDELSVDLMRHAADMPYGTMDFLFIHLMQWGRDNGYRRFNLGLAPLAGIESRRLAPIWARAGAFLYRHGETLYGFEGLRAYKDKFSPSWVPRYIAGPDGVGLARALIDLQTLVGGGRGSAAAQNRLALVA